MGDFLAQLAEKQPASLLRRVMEGNVETIYVALRAITLLPFGTDDKPVPDSVVLHLGGKDATTVSQEGKTVNIYADRIYVLANTTFYLPGLTLNLFAREIVITETSPLANGATRGVVFDLSGVPGKPPSQYGALAATGAVDCTITYHRYAGGDLYITPPKDGYFSFDVADWVKSTDKGKDGDNGNAGGAGGHMTIISDLRSTITPPAGILVRVEGGPGSIGQNGQNSGILGVLKGVDTARSLYQADCNDADSNHYRAPYSPPPVTREHIPSQETANTSLGSHQSIGQAGNAGVSGATGAHGSLSYQTSNGSAFYDGSTAPALLAMDVLSMKDYISKRGQEKPATGGRALNQQGNDAGDGKMNGSDATELITVESRLAVSIPLKFDLSKLANATHLYMLVHRMQWEYDQISVSACFPADAKEGTQDWPLDKDWSTTLTWAEAVFRLTWPKVVDPLPVVAGDAVPKLSVEDVVWRAIVGLQVQRDTRQDLYRYDFNSVPVLDVRFHEVQDEISRLQQIESSLATLGTAVEHANSVTDALKTEIKGHKDSIDALNLSMTELESDIQKQITLLHSTERTMQDKRWELNNNVEKWKDEWKKLDDCPMAGVFEALSNALMFGGHGVTKGLVAGAAIGVGVAAFTGITNAMKEMDKAKILSQYLISRVGAVEAGLTPDKFRSAYSATNSLLLKERCADSTALLAVERDDFLDAINNFYADKPTEVIASRRAFQAFMDAVDSRNQVISAYNKSVIALLKAHVDVAVNEEANAAINDNAPRALDNGNTELLYAFFLRISTLKTSVVIQSLYRLIRAYNCAHLSPTTAYKEVIQLSCAQNLTSATLSTVLSTLATEMINYRTTALELYSNATKVEVKLDVKDAANADYVLALQDDGLTAWTPDIENPQDISLRSTDWNVRLRGYSIFLKGARSFKMDDNGTFMLVKVMASGPDIPVESPAAVPDPNKPVATPKYMRFVAWVAPSNQAVTRARYVEVKAVDVHLRWDSDFQIRRRDWTVNHYKHTRDPLVSSYSYKDPSVLDSTTTPLKPLDERFVYATPMAGDREFVHEVPLFSPFVRWNISVKTPSPEALDTVVDLSGLQAIHISLDLLRCADAVKPVVPPVNVLAMSSVGDSMVHAPAAQPLLYFTPLRITRLLGKLTAASAIGGLGVGVYSQARHLDRILNGHDSGRQPKRVDLAVWNEPLKRLGKTPLEVSRAYNTGTIDTKTIDQIDLEISNMLLEQYFAGKADNVPASEMELFARNSPGAAIIEGHSMVQSGAIPLKNPGEAALLLEHAPVIWTHGFASYNPVILDRNHTKAAASAGDYEAYVATNIDAIHAAAKNLISDPVARTDMSGLVARLTSDNYISFTHDRHINTPNAERRAFSNNTTGQHILDGTLKNTLVRVPNEETVLWCIHHQGQNANRLADPGQNFMARAIGRNARETAPHVLEEIKNGWTRPARITESILKDPQTRTRFEILASAARLTGRPLAEVRAYLGPNVVFVYKDINSFIAKAATATTNAEYQRALDNANPVTPPTVDNGFTRDGLPIDAGRILMGREPTSLVDMRATLSETEANAALAEAERIIEELARAEELPAPKLTALGQGGQEYVNSRVDLTKKESVVEVRENMSRDPDLAEIHRSSARTELLHDNKPQINHKMSKDSNLKKLSNAERHQLADEIGERLIVDKAVAPDGIVIKLSHEVVEKVVGKSIAADPKDFDVEKANLEATLAGLTQSTGAAKAALDALHDPAHIGTSQYEAAAKTYADALEQENARKEEVEHARDKADSQRESVKRSQEAEASVKEGAKEWKMPEEHGHDGPGPIEG